MRQCRFKKPNNYYIWNFQNKQNTLKNVIVHMILEKFQMSTVREIINILPVGVLKKIKGQLDLQ